MDEMLKKIRTAHYEAARVQPPEYDPLLVFPGPSHRAQDGQPCSRGDAAAYGARIRVGHSRCDGAQARGVCALGS